MDKPKYIYDLDDHPPLRLAILYGLQWAFIIFPIFIASAVLPARVLQLGPVEEVRFLQLILLSSGIFTTIQCLWGHRYPIIEGPSAALLLTFLVIAPYGLPAVQAGGIAGGLLLMAAVIIVKPKRIISVMTPNVVGVILMLISLTLLPYMSALMSGAGSSSRGGSAAKFLLSVGLVLLMSAMAYRLRGFFKTVWLLTGNDHRDGPFLCPGTSFFQSSSILLMVLDSTRHHSLKAAINDIRRGRFRAYPMWPLR